MRVFAGTVIYVLNRYVTADTHKNAYRTYTPVPRVLLKKVKDINYF